MSTSNLEQMKAHLTQSHKHVAKISLRLLSLFFIGEMNGLSIILYYHSIYKLGKKNPNIQSLRKCLCFFKHLLHVFIWDNNKPMITSSLL